MYFQVQIVLLNVFDLHAIIGHKWKHAWCSFEDIPKRGNSLHFFGWANELRLFYCLQFHSTQLSCTFFYITSWFTHNPFYVHQLQYVCTVVSDLIPSLIYPLFCLNYLFIFYKSTMPYANKSDNLFNSGNPMFYVCIGNLTIELLKIKIEKDIEYDVLVDNELQSWIIALSCCEAALNNST